MDRPSKTKSIQLLNTALNAIPELKSMPGSPEFDKWHRSTRVTISNILLINPSTFRNSRTSVTPLGQANIFERIAVEKSPNYLRGRAILRSSETIYAA